MVNSLPNMTINYSLQTLYYHIGKKWKCWVTMGIAGKDPRSAWLLASALLNMAVLWPQPCILMQQATSDETKACIPALCHQGHSVKEICHLLGVKKILVYNVLTWHSQFGTVCWNWQSCVQSHHHWTDQIADAHMWCMSILFLAYFLHHRYIVWAYCPLHIFNHSPYSYVWISAKNPFTPFT